jgi:transcriptional regulator with GAF, ATPase, and Fis domain
VSLQQLRWLILGVPIAFLTILEGVRLLFEPSVARSPLAYGLEAVVVAAGLLAFGEMVVRAADRMQERHIHQNRELLALHEAGLAVARELRLETVLQRVVDQARDLAHAQYAALAVLREDGSIEAFLTSGITPEERARIGPLPTGKGLLGVVLREGQRLRLRDMTSDHRTAGFPPNHPPMRSLLAVPILAADRVMGKLYLTDKNDSKEYTIDDE